MMELKDILQSLDGKLTRYTDYELIEEDGETYILPTESASAERCCCTELLGTIVADALEYGRQLYTKQGDRNRLCLDFVRKYGFLDNWSLKEFKRQMPPIPERPLIPTEWYVHGEAVSDIELELQRLYDHFQWLSRDPVGLEIPADLTGELSYCLTGGRTPQIKWICDSLRGMLRLAYTVMLTTSPRPLKVCKSCGRIYYNPHGKSEFCQTKCRNRYNVKAFRERKAMEQGK